MSKIKRSAESRPYRGCLSRKLQMSEGCLPLERVLRYSLLKPFRVYNLPGRHKVWLPPLLTLPLHVCFWVNVAEKEPVRSMLEPGFLAKPNTGASETHLQGKRRAAAGAFFLWSGRCLLLPTAFRPLSRASSFLKSLLHSRSWDASSANRAGVTQT